MNELEQQRQKQQAYQQIVKQFQPAPPYVRNTVAAFVVGGLISLFGQLITDLYGLLGLTAVDAGPRTAVTLIVLAGLATGFGWYDELGRIGGAGAAVPITGFANSVVAPAMEFAREGFVTGMATKMFIVAGPVIVFGLAASIVMGVLRWLVVGG